MATVSKVYNKDSGILTWLCPGGITRIKLKTQSLRKGLYFCGLALVEPFGNAFAWGPNDSGQNGDGSVTYRSSPVAIAATTQFRKLFLGSTISYGLSEWGQLMGWGLNSNGGLGLGDIIPRSSPVAVLGSLRLQDIAENGAGGPGLRILALSTGGAAYAIGLNTDGELGVGDVTPRSSPVAVLGSNLFRSLVMGGQFLHVNCYGIDYNNKAWAWGYNVRGQLGLGDVVPRSSPVAVLSSVGAACKVIACGGDGSGNAHTYFIDTSGFPYACGFNGNGQLGVGDVTPRSSPVAVLGVNSFSKVECDNNAAAMFLTSTGLAYALGLNTNGNLGVGDVVPRSSPVAVLGGNLFSKVKGIGGSWWGLTTTGVLMGWGLNANGQLGVGDVVPRSSPVAVLGSLKIKDFQPFSSTGGNIGVLMVTPQGQVYAVGGNTKGELALNDVVPRSSPVAVVGGSCARTLDDWEEVLVDVVPGTTYTITLNRMNASFGNESIGTNVEKVILSYEQ